MFCSTVIESNECYTHHIWRYNNIKRPYSILYFILDGTGFYKINNDQKVKFKKNHLYIMPSNVPFSLSDDENDKIYHAYIHAFIYPEIKQVIEINIEEDEFLSSIFNLIRKYIKTDNPQAPSIYIQKLTEFLISYISDAQNFNESQMFVKVKKYIDENFIDIFKNKNLCNVFNYSQSQITRVFKTAYNITPQKYIDNLILKYIMNMLKQGQSSKEIAMFLGFTSLANFSRYFKNKSGLSPRSFATLQNQQ